MIVSEAPCHPDNTACSHEMASLASIIHNNIMVLVHILDNHDASCQIIILMWVLIIK